MPKSISVIFLLLFVFALPSSVNAETLLDIKSFKVSKNYPAEFLFDLEENDNFILTFNKVGGNADASKVVVEVIDLNAIDEEVLGDFRIPSGSLRIPADGKYLVRFSYTGKDLSLKGRRFANFSLKVESLETEKIQPGEFRTVMQVTSIAIDDDSENALKMIFKVEEGDKITFSSADPKAAIVKVNLQQLGKTGFVNSLNNIVITQDYYLTANIFLSDNDDGSSIYNVRELLRNGDLLFTDLTVSIERQAKSLLSNNSSSPYGNSSSGGSYSTSDPASSSTDAASEGNSYEEYLIQLQEQQLNNAGNSAGMAEALLNSQNMSKEAMDNMLEFFMESTKPKEVVEVFSQPLADITATLGPAGDLFKNNKNSSPKNRMCQELALRPSDFNKWFYWIAVGKKANEAFEEESEKFSRNGRRKELSQAKGEYIYYGNDPENKRFDPPFPNMRNYPSYFTENVEYAIVDDYNKDLFLKGKKYSMINYRRSKMVSVEEGFAFSPPNADVIYYVCFCNDNKRTPIDVTFKYYSIEIEKSTR